MQTFCVRPNLQHPGVLITRWWDGGGVERQQCDLSDVQITVEVYLAVPATLIMPCNAPDSHE